VTLLYVTLNAAFLFAAPIGKLAGEMDVARIAAAHLGGRTLADGISALIALALATSASSLVMAGPRVYQKMALDGYVPKCLLSKGPAPVRAIALQATIALIILRTATSQALLTYVGFTLGLSTAATVVGLIRLRIPEGTNLPVLGW